jgi:hypothetical protein
MDHVPEDIDICVPNDLDEVFVPGWRQQLEAVWEPCHTSARYLFTWSYNPDGTPMKQYSIEKIHRRHGFRWIHPVHEVLVYSGQDPEQAVWVPGMVLRHYPDPHKPRAQYLPLLELSAQENPNDDRTAFWLGREYFYNGQHDKSIAELSRHLTLPSAKMDEERCASMRYIAKCYEAINDLKKARQWLYALSPSVRTCASRIFIWRVSGISNKNWPLVPDCREGLGIKEKTGSYLWSGGGVIAFMITAPSPPTGSGFIERLMNAPMRRFK